MFFILCGVVAWNIGNILTEQVNKNVPNPNQRTSNSTTKNITEKTKSPAGKGFLGLITVDLAPKHYDYQEIWWTTNRTSPTTIKTSKKTTTTKGTVKNIYHKTTFQKRNTTKIVFKPFTFPPIINGTIKQRATIRVKRPKNATRLTIGRKEKSMIQYKNITANTNSNNTVTVTTDKLNYYYIVKKDALNGSFQINFNETGLSVDGVKNNKSRGLLGSIDSGLLMRGIEGGYDNDYLILDYPDDKDNSDVAGDSQNLYQTTKKPLVIKIMRTHDIANSIKSLKPGAKILIDSKQSAKLPQVVKDGIYRIDVPSFQGNDKIANIVPKIINIERAKSLPPNINGENPTRGNKEYQNVNAMQENLNKFTIFGTAVMNETVTKPPMNIPSNNDLPPDYINTGQNSPSFNPADPYYGYDQQHAFGRPNPNYNQMPPNYGNFPQNYPPGQHNNINAFTAYGDLKDSPRTYGVTQLDSNLNKVGNFPYNPQNFQQPHAFPPPNKSNQPPYTALYGSPNDYNMGFDPNENQYDQPPNKNPPYNVPPPSLNDNIQVDYANSYKPQPNLIRQQDYGGPPKFAQNIANGYPQYNPSQTLNNNNFNPNYNPQPYTAPPGQMNGQFNKEINYKEISGGEKSVQTTIFQTSKMYTAPLREQHPPETNNDPTLDAYTINNNIDDTTTLDPYGIHHHPFVNRSTIDLLTATALSITEKTTTPIVVPTLPYHTRPFHFIDFPESSSRSTIDWKTTRVLLELSTTTTTDIPTTTPHKVVYFGVPVEQVPGGIGIDQIVDIGETTTVASEDILSSNLDLIAHTVKVQHGGDSSLVPSSEPPPVYLSHYVKEMLKDMENLKMGYFSVFLIRIFYSVARKTDYAVSRLSKGFEPEYERLSRDAFFAAFGEPFFTEYGKFSALLNGADASYLKAVATTLHYALVNRKSSLTVDYNSLIDYIDSLFTLDEGIRLLQAAEMVEHYPEGDPTYIDVHLAVSEALMEPVRRLINSIKVQILFDSINKILENHMNAKPPLTRKLMKDRRQNDLDKKERHVILLKDKTIEFDTNTLYANPITPKRFTQYTKSVLNEIKTIQNVSKISTRKHMQPKHRIKKKNKQLLMNAYQNQSQFLEPYIRLANKANSQLRHNKLEASQPKLIKNGVSPSTKTHKATKRKRKVSSTIYPGYVFKQNLPINQIPLKSNKEGINKGGDYIESDAFEFNAEFLTTAMILEESKIEPRDVPVEIAYENSKEKSQDQLDEIKKKLDAIEARYRDALDTTSSVVRRYSIKYNTGKTKKMHSVTTNAPSLGSIQNKSVDIMPTNPQPDMDQEAIKNLLEMMNSNTVVKQKEEQPVPKEPSSVTPEIKKHTKKRKKSKHKVKKNHHKHKKLKYHKRKLRHLRLKHPKLYKKYLKRRKRKRHSKNKKTKRHSKKIKTKHKFKKVNRLLKKYNKFGHHYEKRLKNFMLRNKNVGHDYAEDYENDATEESSYDSLDSESYVKPYSSSYERPFYESNDKFDESGSQLNLVGFGSIEQTTKRAFITYQAGRLRPNIFTPIKHRPKTPIITTNTPIMWSHIPLKGISTKTAPDILYNRSSRPALKSDKALLEKFKMFLDKRNTVIKKNRLEKVREVSSYSDEEEDLKHHIFDAMTHNKEYFRSARRINREDDVKTKIFNKLNKFSSYSSEEVIIKTNIYKAIVANNTESSEVKSKYNDNSRWRLPRTGQDYIISSNSDEEKLLRNKLGLNRIAQISNHNIDKAPEY